MPRGKIPRPTVKRLSLYLRQLESLAASDRPTISSRQLGDALGLTDAQVRKDLAYFGQFGHIVTLSLRFGSAFHKSNWVKCFLVCAPLVVYGPHTDDLDSDTIWQAITKICPHVKRQQRISVSKPSMKPQKQAWCAKSSILSQMTMTE